MELYCGFKTINFEDSHEASRRKGRRLLESGHVLMVKEKLFTGHSVITGFVVRQTSVNKSPYEVVIHLNEIRKSTSAHCDCAAGEGGLCKHVWAVVEYCNSDEGRSQTDSPQQWGKPPAKTAGKQIYAKGKMAAELFPRRSSTEEIAAAPLSVLKRCKVNCPFMDLLRVDESCDSIFVMRSILNELVNIAVNSVEEKEFNRQLKSLLRQKCILFLPNDILPPSTTFYRDKICLTQDDICNVAFATVLQAECSEWMERRRLRISASKAHQVLHTRHREKLVKKLLHPSAFDNEDLSYGRRTEKDGVAYFKQTTKKDIILCGVLIDEERPWLCASPDGPVVTNGKITSVLEIKCPRTCSQKPIIEYGVPNVKYVELSDSGMYYLKENTSHYTQCQYLMYCTGLEEVDFLVYSPKGALSINVRRNDTFLTTTIPVLADFFFNHYLPVLSEDYDLNKES